AAKMAIAEEMEKRERAGTAITAENTARRSQYYKEVEDYNKWLAGADERRMKREEHLTKQQKAPSEIELSQANAAKARAEAEAGKVPTVKECNGIWYQFNPTTKQWEVPPTAGGGANEPRPDL